MAVSLLGRLPFFLRLFRQTPPLVFRINYRESISLIFQASDWPPRSLAAFFMMTAPEMKQVVMPS